MPLTDVIIPCRNEEKTIGAIVRTFNMCPMIRSVIVSIDVDTIDNTAYVASQAGGLVHLALTKGKGQVIRAALPFVDGTQTILCDGDYGGLTTTHIESILGQGHIIGVPDFPQDEIIDSPVVKGNPEWFFRIANYWAQNSGFRNVPTHILEGLELHGYLVETQVNMTVAAHKISTMMVPLPGLYSPWKMGEQRVREMLRDRAWGIQKGILRVNHDAN